MNTCCAIVPSTRPETPAEALFLIVAPAGRDATVIGQLLGSAALTHMTDVDGEALLAAITSGMAAGAIITDEVLAGLDGHRLCQAIEQQPPWSDFPVILLVRRGETRLGSRMFDDLLNVTILERPLHPASLISAARGARRMRRRQRLGAQHLAERERARAELRNLADTLEARVEARTRDLIERTAERDRTWNNTQDLLLIIGGDGVIQDANPAWTRLLGWNRDAIIGRHHRDFSHPDDRPASDQALGRVRADQPSGHVGRVPCHDGGYRDIAWIATRDGDRVYASGRDVTAEKRAADALQAAESRIQAVFDTTRLMQGYMNPDGMLLDVNQTALETIGAKRADVIGRPFWDAPWFSVTPGLPDQVRANVRVAATGQLVEQEITLDLPSGARSFAYTMRPVADATGQVVGIVPEAIETTDRRRAEESLRQAQKMEAVGQLTGGIAHDFNNLLAGIMGNLELLHLRLAQGRLEGIDRFVNAAQGAGQRAAALTQRLLAFSRRQTLDPRPTDIDRLIAGMEDLLRRSVGPSIAIDVAATPDLWTALIDAGQLENALLNLCINGRDAMPDGGRLTVRTANIRIDTDAAREQDVPAGEYVSMCVTDTGTGMPPDVIARAFDPFFTTKPLGQGTGLGLSMIYGFARQSGGQVRIDSVVGSGTTICILLPRHDGQAAEQAITTGPAAAAAVSGGGRTVLVVDDEHTVRLLIDEVLDDLGYTVIAVADAAAGMAVIESPARIDLLVTDVGLPGGMNGRQLADAARALRPALKILFITGYAEQAVIGAGQLEPGMELLTKPFALDGLRQRVRDLTSHAP